MEKTMRRSLFAFAGLACVGVAAMAVQTPSSMAAGPKPELGDWGVDLTAMDKTVKPGDDFFMYVNGTWYKNAVIPPDRASTGSFQSLRIRSEKQIQEIVDALEAKPYDQLSGEEKKLRDFYDAFMDQKQIDQRGLAPVKKDLALLAGLKTKVDVARAMGNDRLQMNTIFNVGPSVDDKNPEAYAVTLVQGGIGLPNRDYYLKDDKDLAAARDAYKKYVAQMFTLAGLKDAQPRADAVYDFEAKIAEAQWPNADRRDEDKIYNPMTVSELKKFAPDFPWDAFLKSADVPLTGPKGERVVIVAEKSAFPKIAAIFAATPVPVLRDYLTAHYLHSFSPYLPKTFDDTDFAFYGTAISGNTQQLPRATRAVHLIDNNIGEALGKLYVAKFFPPEAKAKAEELVGNLLKAYDADIRTLPWMTEATRLKALDKLHLFTPHIGYPDTWRDYSKLAIARGDLVGDVQASALFEWHRQMDRIDQKVDKSEWGMTPPTVNAYYFPPFNEIVFPAAILQPPFFDANADDAVNYGGIGAVIGHEISHGFDDQGSKYDGTGRLNKWWTDEDRKNFDAKTGELGKQYDSYEPLPGLHVNGAFTMGENIADNAGIAIALKAYRLSLGGKPAPVLDGYTGEQRFYLSYGQVWRAKLRDGALRAQVLSNEHSPPQFRAIGATRNQDAWYDAFGAKPGDKYYLAPDKRVGLW
jgi:putative endopeptidase